MDKDTFYSVLTDSDECSNLEMQRTDAQAAALLHMGHCERIWPAGTKQANCSIVDCKSKQKSSWTPNI